MFRDVRLAVRTLTRRPAATFLVIALLGVGLGANLLVFSVVQGMLLRPLEFPDADRLVRIFVRHEVASNDRLRATEAEFRDWKEHAEGFDSVVAAANFGMSVTESPEPLNPLMRQVSAGYFRTFGATPFLGRDFSPDDHRTMAKVVILDYGFWRSYYGGDPEIVGRAIELAGEPHEVIGVMPAEWNLPAFPRQPVLWAPMAETADMDRQSGRFIVMGRLAADAEPGVVERQLTSIQKRRAEELGTDDGRSARVVPLRASLVENIRPAILALFGAITLMLAIVLANVAHLLLARAIGRRQEIGVRVALGAGRWHLVRQLLTEGLLVAGLGGALGVVLAAAALPAVLATAPANLAVPLLDRVALDVGVVTYAVVLSLAVAGLCALLPLWHLRRGTQAVVRPTGRGGAGGPQQRRWRNTLLVAEVALSMALLIGAGLMARSFVNLRSLELGFDPEQLLVLRVGPRGPGLETPEERDRFYRQALEQVRDLPGVESAGFNDILPMFASFRSSVGIRALETPAGEAERRAVALAATPGYLDTVRTPLLAGRDFASQDRVDSEPVAILSRNVMESMWGEDVDVREVIGRRVVVGDDGELVRIVGISADLRGLAQAPEPPPVVYRPMSQAPVSPASLFVRREPGADIQGTFDAVERVMWGFSSEIPVYSQSTLRQIVRDIEWQPRFLSQLLSSFATLALLLTAAGIYAVISFSVAERTREIGVRVALGADRNRIMTWIVGRAGRLTVLGIALGFALSAVASRLLATQLQGVSPFDPWTYAVLSVGMAFVSLAAAWIPAHRALKVDPASALRSE
ncbi:MAG: ABC transporter permease [Thermoanaerobaculia bacterium]|nr:ABC transporter permease [Thermoanaerobaculia bacterium]